MAIALVNTWLGSLLGEYGSSNVTVASSNGNWLVAIAGWNPMFATNPIAQVCDDARNYWIPAGTSSSSGTTRATVWVAPNARAATEVSVSPAASVHACGVVILEFSGMPTYALIDVINSATASSTTTFSTTLACTAADVAFAAVAVNNHSAAPTVSGTFSAVGSSSGTDGFGDVAVTGGWQTTGGSGTITATFTTGVSCSGSIFAVAFKQTAPAPVQVNPAWPAIQDQIAWGYKPGGATTLPTWTDVTARVAGFTASRGRQYELDQLQAGTGVLTLLNNDGTFDPTNTSGTYYPNVVPYVPYRRLATWNGITYPVFFGYVERWPQAWTDALYGVSQAEVVDTLAPLAAVNLPSPITSEVQPDAPYAYWPLNDQQTSTTAGNLSGRTQTILTQRISQVGVGSTNAGFGATLTLAGDNGTGWSLSGAPVTGSAFGSSLFISDPGLPQPSAGFGIELWALGNVPSSGTPQALFVNLVSTGQSTSFQPAFSFIGGGASLNTPTLQAANNSGANSVQAAGHNMLDGLWHHYFMWVTSTTGSLWIDGTEVITNHSWGFTLPDGLQILTINGLSTSTLWFAGLNGTFAHVAVYDVQPSAQRILAHYQVGATGFPETSGLRAQRILGYGGWTQARLIDDGNSTMQPCSDIENLSVPDALGHVQVTERGVSSVDGSGTIRFRSRNFGYNRTPKYALGDNPGETPYLGDLTWDYDPTFINNRITVARNQGGQGYAVDTTSESAYFVRALSTTTYANDDPDATDQANWLLGQFKDPHLRVSEITLDPASNANIWPVALGIEVGDVVTVTRRPRPAPALTGTFVVQQVAHDIGPGQWLTKLILAPVQPYVLTCNDSTYDILGSWPLAW